MASPMITRPGRIGLFAPQYCGSVRYYAAMACYGYAAIDAGMRRDKRFKSAHRCEIADTRGLLRLTVPVEKVTQPTPWSGVAVSAHGCWWEDHAVSLESAYGRTPYFEYYYPRLKPFLTKPAPGLSITDLDAAFDAELRRILCPETRIITAEEALAQQQLPVDDMRRQLPEGIADVPYYQVRADKLGFIPGLSALDLAFNLGPEAQLTLSEMAADMRF